MMKKAATSFVFAVLCSFCSAEITITPWQEIFNGVYHCTGRADINEPEFQLVNALKIDTQADGVEIFVTPAKGPKETIGQKTGEFLEEHDLKAAVNGGFFAPSSNATNIPNQPKELFGLVVSQGEIVSGPEGFDPADECKGQSVMVFNKDGNARICNYKEVGDLDKVYNSVAGGPVIMTDGKILIKKDDPEEKRYIYQVHPRTAAGVSADGRYVYFISVDGRQKGYAIGEDLYGTAMWLKRFGASDALNLDGGGSATMVRADYIGNQILLNGPSDAWQRFNGSNIGVKADKLPIEKKEYSEIIAYEGFDYQSRPFGTSQNKVPFGGGLEALDGGAGWIIGWKDRMAKTGAFAGISNERLILPDAEFARCQRYIDLGCSEACYLKDCGRIGADGTSLWISFYGRCDNKNPAYFAYLQLGENLQIGKIGTPLESPVWAVKFEDKIAVSKVDVTGATAFLVKISFKRNQDELQMWLNPAAAKSQEQLPEPDVIKIMDDFGFYHLSVCGSYAEFDEIRIGKTFDSVAGQVGN